MVVLAFAAEGGIQLVPDGTILIHIALVLLMIWVLNRTFFRPINRVIAARERNKGGRSGEALDILKQANEKSSRYETEMRQARAEGYSLIESTRATALAERQARVDSVKAETAQTISQEKASIQKQSEVARGTIAAEAEKLAEKISSNILRA
jgi:F-type H+-transporting ATPase subunit b